MVLREQEYSSYPSSARETLFYNKYELEAQVALQNMATITTTTSKKRKERALVMQGGGSLGAYEAGVYEVLYHRISESLQGSNRTNENVFDIIAGTSIGAINGAIIINHVLENKR